MAVPSWPMPYGYGDVIVTPQELMTKNTFNRLHPEMRRRFLALSYYLYTIGVPLGVGTGWRIQPPNKPGFAEPGNSWHEGVPVASLANALAIDTVPASSWAKMEPVLARFGLRSFRSVNNEPWHIQPIEIPTSRRYATTLPPLRTWTLPDIADPTPPTTVPPGGTEITVTFQSRVMSKGMSGNDVKFFQEIIQKISDHTLVVDGQFGSKTETAVRNWQAWFGLTVDGVLGAQTQGHMVGQRMTV